MNNYINLRLKIAVIGVLFILSGLSAEAQLKYYIGTGTQTNCNTCFPTPFRDIFMGTRMQYLYLASELTGAGMGPGFIMGTEWNIDQVAASATFYGWTLKIGTTTNGSLGGAFVPVTQVHGPLNGPYNPGVGPKSYMFTTPFYWNGTDNVVVETCHGDATRAQSTWTTDAQVKYTNTSYISGIAVEQDNAGTLCARTNIQYTFNYRPNITFIYAAPCKDTPNGYTVNAPDSVCPEQAFTVGLNGPYQSDIIYRWSYSNNGNNWSNYIGPVSSNGEIVDSIKNERWYRCTLICKNSNKTYTTPAKYVGIYEYYYCYCSGSRAADTSGIDIGNITILDSTSGTERLNNGNADPLFPNKTANKKYSNFQHGRDPVVFYRDSIYEFKVTQINSSTTGAAGRAFIFLDLNRDGQFEPLEERVMDKPINAATGIAQVNFKIPGLSAAKPAGIGLTGLRIIISPDSLGPCSGFAQGETEDYLVDIRWAPCTDSIRVTGRIEGDSSMCTGYDYVILDTTYEKNVSGFIRQWQVSGDQQTWYYVQGATNKDMIERVFNGQPVYYRVELVCQPTEDTTRTEVFTLRLKDASKCYCFSQAVGGKFSDSSDIGGFELSSIYYQDGGPHLQNPRAVRKRTDWTDDEPLEIDVDSTYLMRVFHTQKSDIHADGKITVFMDFNNNHQYDIPEDKVFEGMTTVSTFTLVDSVKIKKLAILNVPTGLRVILNNDLRPSNASDMACGTYASGETEDYMVIFRQKGNTTVGALAGSSEAYVYPNPTTGKFTVKMNTASQINDVKVIVKSVTGQQIYQNNYKLNNNSFEKELDLSSYAKGVYFIEFNTGSEKIVEKLIIK